MEKQVCSNLDVPLFTSHTFYQLLMSHFDQTDDDSIDVLLKLCQEIIDKASNAIDDVVAPQVHSRVCSQISTEDGRDSRNTSVTE